MLFLNRKEGEKLVIGDNITITVVKINNGRTVRLGFEAPKEVPVHREEVKVAIDKQNKESHRAPPAC